MTTTTTDHSTAPVLGRLSTLDRYLPVWIVAAMALGLLLGRAVPGLDVAVLGWFYLQVLPGWLGLTTARLEVSTWDIARSVLVFLGIPLAAGFLTRVLGERAKGASGTKAPSSRGSGRSPSTACCSPSWSSSRCRAPRSPAARLTWPGSRCPCWPTSR